jgi:hypothetical protein
VICDAENSNTCVPSCRVLSTELAFQMPWVLFPTLECSIDRLSRVSRSVGHLGTTASGPVWSTGGEKLRTTSFSLQHWNMLFRKNVTYSTCRPQSETRLSSPLLQLYANFSLVLLPASLSHATDTRLTVYITRGAFLWKTLFTISSRPRVGNLDSALEGNSMLNLVQDP